jgi:hypothetical protein
MNLLDRWRNRPRPVLNVIERTKRKAVYGAISLGTIIGVIAVLIVKGCT